MRYFALLLTLLALAVPQPRGYAQLIAEDGSVEDTSETKKAEHRSSKGNTKKKAPKKPGNNKPKGENETTYLVNDSTVTDFEKMDPELIVDRLQCLEKDVPLRYFEPVHRIIEFYTVKRHHYTERMMALSQFYFPIFEEYLRKHNIPEEIKYLAVVESALNPMAVSRSGAVGLWQFMPMTAREMGLTVNGYIDERRDIHKSTEAACRYLKRLYKYTGDWELALAAYNCGPGYVNRAVRRSGYKKTYRDIYRFLPRETRAYVPSFVSVAYAFNYADEHYLHYHPDSVLNLTFDTVHVDHYLDLERFAEEIDVEYEELRGLNPALKVSYIPSHLDHYILNIPHDRKACFSANREQIMDSASKRNFERIEHIVRSGNSLGSIANYYGVTVAELKDWNGLSGNMIHPGQKLVMWKHHKSKTSAYRSKKSKPRPKAQANKSKSKNKNVYIVQPGDTLWSISQRKDTSVDRIMQLNGLKTKHLRPGQRLVIG